MKCTAILMVNWLIYATNI